MDVEQPLNTGGWITRRRSVGGQQDETNTFHVGKPGPGKTFMKQSLPSRHPIIPVQGSSDGMEIDNKEAGVIASETTGRAGRG